MNVSRFAGLVLVLALALLSRPLPAAHAADSSPAASTNAPAKPKLPPVIPVALTNILSAAESGEWRKSGVWTAVPAGRTNDFAGVRFWLDGLVQLQGKSAAAQSKKYREKVVLALPKPTNFTTLHLLGGTAWADGQGVKVAEVVWRYADGTFRRTPLNYGVHMRDWWGRRYEEPATVADAHSKCVWKGVHPDTSGWGRYLRFYLTSVRNPDTNKVVRSLEFVSAMAQPTLFITGITLDPLPPGARDGGFTDLDQGRPGLTGTQYVTVLDSATDKPVSGAQVATHGRESVGTPDQSDYDREGVTLANGVAAVQKSETGLDQLEIRVDAEGYVGFRKTFDLKKGDVLPLNLEVKIKGGLTIGGIVQDPDGQPLAGVRVSGGTSWGSEIEREVVEKTPFDHRTVTTDADGKWSMKGVPEPLLPSLYLNASHPDYVSAGFGTRGNEKSEEQLKKQTYVIKLLRGSEVTGVVLGPDEKPFSGATVKAGQRWGGDNKKEIKTGADGRFRLLNLRPDIQPVTATADGYTPASKVVTPGTNAIEITLQLKQGGSLKGIVLDPEGQPVSGARLVYELRDYDSRVSNNIEWEGQTDGEGRFEWKGAPEGESEFYVFKQGFAQKRGVKAKAGPEDNIIRLSRVRKVIGVVGDSQTGKPITRFTIMPAVGDGENLRSWSDSQRKSYSDPEGHFTLELGEEEHNVIQVGAEDHVPKLFALPPAQNDYVTVTVLLDPGEGPAGVVVDPAGNPVPGAEVALVTKNANNVNLRRGRLNSYGAGNLVRSDEQGRFKLLVEADPRRVIATSEHGYAEATIEEFQQTKTLVLLPWGRIEATVLSGGKPVPGRSYMFFIRPEGWGEGSLNVDWDGYKAETDAEGKFTMGKVPPGQRGLVRLVQTEPNSFAYSQVIPVEVKAGETTVVTLGGSGATITGHADGAAVMAGKEGARINGGLHTPHRLPPAGLNTPEEFRAWAELPETKEAQKSFRNYTAEFKPDGTFSLDGVPPGEYTMSLSASMRKSGGQTWEMIPLGHFERPVSVPEAAETSIVPIDLGEMVLLPATSPGAIPPAP